MATTYTATPQDLAEYQSFDAYEDWQRHEGVRVVTGFYAAVTSAPTILRWFHDEDFVFGNDHSFRSRFGDEEGYFSGEGQMFKRKHFRIWKTNFVADAHGMDLPERPDRGGGGRNVQIDL